MTNEETVTPDRMNAFSGVFAVIITILVLALRSPKEASFGALLELWPTGVSDAISYLFITIVWVNHHHLLQFPDVATHRLIRKLRASVRRFVDAVRHRMDREHRSGRLLCGRLSFS